MSVLCVESYHSNTRPPTTPWMCVPWRTFSAWGTPVGLGNHVCVCAVAYSLCVGNAGRRRTQSNTHIETGEGEKSRRMATRNMGGGPLPGRHPRPRTKKGGPHYGHAPCPPPRTTTWPQGGTSVPPHLRPARARTIKGESPRPPGPPPGLRGVLQSPLTSGQPGPPL